jgi:penicillin-binding protein 2
MKDQALKGFEFRFRFFSVTVLSIFALLTFRLWFLQIIKGNETSALSRRNQSREIKIPAERGIFFDHNGKVMAFSRISHVVSVVPDDVQKHPRVIDFLSHVLQMKKKDLLQLIEEKGKNHTKSFVPILSDVDSKAVGQILEAKLDLPGVEVEAYPIRYYPNGEWAAHLFGYIGELNADELKRLRDEGYKLGDVIGKTGLEKAYESYLRGKEGGRVIEVDRRGKALRVLEQWDSYPGNNLQLSIDYELQDTAEKMLREHLIWLREKSRYKKARSGAVIAIDPRNGLIRAMVSYPGYDPNLFVGNTRGNIGDLLVDPLYPFTNRVTQGEFMPGSTFKPITVMAALEEGKVDKDSTFVCTGYDRIFHSKFKCWNVRNSPDGHGRQDLIESLQNSCNMTMAELARLVGPEGLAKYSRLFGFGAKTGLDLPPGENAGLVGDPEWKAQRYTKEPKWYPLETLHYSIGQGYINVTPLQLAMMYSAIANGGKFYTPQVVEAITSPEGKTVRKFQPKLERTAEFDPEHLEIIREGLKRVVSKGTANTYFKDFPLEQISIAGKTGTAQNRGKDDYALFASFAPADKPELVVIVVIEEGGSGGMAGAPIARNLYETYFNIKKEESVPAKRESSATTSTTTSARSEPGPTANELTQEQGTTE